MDIVGPFPEGPGRVKFLIVAIDYFTKWCEAKPLATITGLQVERFAIEHIVCRFGLPHEIVTDNGKQFAENPFKTWCQGLQIKQCFTSVAHPQANGQVERMNRSLVEGIKARLESEGGKWVDQLAHVLWAHRTLPKTSNGETPFSLTYGTEAVIPPEIGMPTHRCANMLTDEENEAQLRSNLDNLTERREIAAIREAAYKQKIEKYYNQRVKPTSFKVDDYVWRKNEASRVEKEGKLGPKWEGPYQVVKAHSNGSYELQDLHGRHIPRTWNGMNLRKCYL